MVGSKGTGRTRRVAQFALDGLGTAQAEASLTQALSGRHDQLPDALG